MSKLGIITTNSNMSSINYKFDYFLDILLSYIERLCNMFALHMLYVFIYFSLILVAYISFCCSYYSCCCFVFLYFLSCLLCHIFKFLVTFSIKKQIYKTAEQLSNSKINI